MESAKRQARLRSLPKQQIETTFYPPDHYINLGLSGFPIQKHFSGRQQERIDISNWYNHGDRPVLFIEGMHGLGASKLTWVSVTQDILGQSIPSSDDDLYSINCPESTDKPVQFFWICFSDQTKSFEDVILQSVKHFCMHHSTDNDILPDTIDVAISYFLHIVQEKKTLVVLDGIAHHLRDMFDYEEFQMDHKFGPNRLIKQLSILTNCKTIITTHTIPDELVELAGCQNMNLKPLPDADALKYLMRRGINLPKQKLQDHIDRCLGNPLALKIIADGLLHSQNIPELEPPSNSRLRQRIRDDFIQHLTGKTQNVAHLCAKHSDRSKNYIIEYHDLLNDEQLQPLGIKQGYTLSKCLFELKIYGLLGTEAIGRYYLHPVYREILLEEEKENV